MFRTDRPRPLLKSARSGVLAYLLAALVLTTAGSAFAAPGDGALDELGNGRLGYKWVPDPPRQSYRTQHSMWHDVAKYGGGAVAGLWVLKKLFGDD